MNGTAVFAICSKYCAVSQSVFWQHREKVEIKVAFLWSYMRWKNTYNFFFLESRKPLFWVSRTEPFKNCIRFIIFSESPKFRRNLFRFVRNQTSGLGENNLLDVHFPKYITLRGFTSRAKYFTLSVFQSKWKTDFEDEVLGGMCVRERREVTERIRGNVCTWKKRSNKTY